MLGRRQRTATLLRESEAPHHGLLCAACSRRLVLSSSHFILQEVPDEPSPDDGANDSDDQVSSFVLTPCGQRSRARKAFAQSARAGVFGGNSEHASVNQPRVSAKNTKARPSSLSAATFAPSRESAIAVTRSLSSNVPSRS